MAIETPDESHLSKLKLLDKVFKCTVCDNDQFLAQRIRIQCENPGGMFPIKDFSNCLICSKCGYMHWFLPKIAHKPADEEETGD